MQFKHFDIEEFYCKCSRQHSEHNISERLVFMLDLARERAGVPFVISSGYRCPEHNEEVGGVSDSAHLKGKAADIAVSNNHVRFLMLRTLITMGFKRLGVGKNFIHADIDDDKPSPRIWVY